MAHISSKENLLCVQCLCFHLGCREGAITESHSTQNYSAVLKWTQLTAVTQQNNLAPFALLAADGA